MVADDLTECPGGDGFLEEVEGTEGCSPVAVFGEDILGGDDDPGFGVFGADVHDEIDAVSIGQVDIDDEELDVEGSEQQAGFVEGGGPEDLGVGEFRVHGLGEGHGGNEVVLEDEDGDVSHKCVTRKYAPVGLLRCADGAACLIKGEGLVETKTFWGEWDA